MLGRSDDARSPLAIRLRDMDGFSPGARGAPDAARSVPKHRERLAQADRDVSGKPPHLGFAQTLNRLTASRSFPAKLSSWRAVSAALAAAAVLSSVICAICSMRLATC